MNWKSAYFAACILPVALAACKPTVRQMNRTTSSTETATTETPDCASNGETGCVTNESFLAGAPQSSFSGLEGILALTIPEGYYSGTETATAVDSNLLAGNIKNGVTLFGVTGSFAGAGAYAACTDNALNAAECSTAANRYVTGTLGGAVTGANGQLTKAIPAGYYDGTTSATMSDTNLVAANLLSTATIFGVTGSVSACLAGNQTGCVSSASFPSQSTPATPAAAGNVLTGKQFYAGGAMVTGTMADNGAPTITPGTGAQALSAGYYSGGSVQGDADLLAANIKSGVNVFGVDGSLTAAYAACTDNALNAAQCSTAANRYVTGTLGGAVTGASGELTKTIPAGYYDGTTSATMSDGDLLAANIRSGVNVFGVDGTLAATYAACTDNALNAAECSTAANRYVTGTLGGAVTGASGELTKTIPAGYYDGTTSATMSDGDLLAANIKSGVNVFGVDGSLTAAYAACTDNALNAGQCSTAANRYVTGTLGGAVTGASGELTKTIPAGYYDGTTSATMSDGDLLAANIKSGVNVFGVDGSLTAAYAACTDNALNAGQCSTAANRYVTGTLGGAVTGASGELTKTIPAGYYDGTTSATMSDTNLVAANLLSTATIFGVTGSVSACLAGNQTGCVSSASFPSQSTPATPAAAGNVLTGKQFYAGGAMVTGSMADRGAAWDLATAFPGAGYYSGITSAVAASSVCSTQNFLGSAGTAKCVSGSTANPAGAVNILSTYEAWDANGTKITGTMANNGSPSFTPGTSDQTLSAGYYSGGTVQGDADLVAANIKSGVSVFGVTGSLSITGFLDTNAYRTDNSTTTLANLRNPAWVDARVRAKLTDELNGNATFTSNHRLVPDPKYDTDGYDDTTGIGQIKLNYLETIQAGRPTVVCGTVGTTEERITDCATANGAKAIWEGAKYGKGSEGDWKLVTLTNDGTRNWEVWRDERTRLLWSDSTFHVATAFGNKYNWFQAAGYAKNASTLSVTAYEGGTPAATGKTYAANCSDNATQTCQPDTPISVCADASVIAGLNGIPNYTTPDNNYPKGNLGVASTPVVSWRLPTIEDWRQANLNGARKVLPNMTTPTFWSASSFSVFRSNGWLYYGSTGEETKDNRNVAYSVRCIGATP